MPVKRKKSGEERESVAVVPMCVPGTGLLQRGKVVRVGLSLQAKRELLQQKAPQYRSTSPAPLSVQEVLVLAWEKMNCICAKRLMPFLPTFLEALERHEHVQVSETCREQLLSMSATTAERLLRLQRRHGPRGLSTTRAGTLLKQVHAPNPLIVEPVTEQHDQSEQPLPMQVLLD